MKVSDTKRFEAVDALRAAHLARFTQKREADKKTVASLFTDFTAAAAGKSKLLRNAEFLQYFADKFPIQIEAGEKIVGTIWHWTWGAGLPDMTGNIGHFIADFANVIALGVDGLTAKAQSIPDAQAENREAAVIAMRAFARYIERHADRAAEMGLAEIERDCRHLTHKAPESFRQALQLVWFAQAFLETEANASALSFGRMDEYLAPFYLADLQAGTLTRDEAMELIMCFYIKASEGDESQMVTLGGASPKGGNVDNDLTVLFLDAQTRINMRQPSICVRINDDTDPKVWKAAIDLARTGNGMPAFFNEKQPIEGLCREGIDRDSAVDFGIVGCYEAAPQGSFSNTVAFAGFLYEALRDFLDTDVEFASYEAFMENFKKYFDTFYAGKWVPEIRKRWDDLCDKRSPFLACCARGCLESGKLPEQLGCSYSLCGLNLMGIGVLIDSLYTIKKLVFERRAVTLRQLREQVRANFDDPDLYEQIRGLQGSYGSNSDETNALAKELSEMVSRAVVAHPIKEGVIVSPALFWFLQDVFDREYPATVNGRRQGELLAYGVLPCASVHFHPHTSVLLSAANVRSDLFPNGCPAMLSIAKKDMQNDAYLQSLVQTYFDCGGFHLAINVVNAEILEKAMAQPEDYPDLIVKISGYSAKFTTLEKRIQTAVLERAKRGI